MHKIMKKLLNYLYCGILFIWQLPQNIVALLMMPFLGKLTLIEHRLHQYVFSGEKMSGGISLGTFIFVSSNCAKNMATIEHEHGHGFDSRKMGPLYIFIIGIPSILHAWLHKNCSCYYDFFTEKRANNNIGTIEVTRSKYGCFLSMKS